MASKTGIVYHEKFLEHDTGPGHPEKPERLRAIVDHLKNIKLWQELQHLIIDEATEEWLLRVHSVEHIENLRKACLRGISILDEGDTHASRESFNAALLAAGGVICAADAVMNKILKNAFCAVRPPGHHAERNRVMGFCLINNVAVAAQYTKYKYGAERILILDWDVHHGNGTQQIFYDDKSVMYISTHQYPFYPGTGSRSEQGIGEGKGYTLNIPMVAGSGEEEFTDAFKEEIIPTIENYRPDIIFISAGFDAHKDDPLANLNLTEESFALFTRMITDSAEKYCDGRIVSVLEGGYNLKALANCVEYHVKVLMGFNS